MRWKPWLPSRSHGRRGEPGTADRAADARAYQLSLTSRAERIILRLEERADRLRNDYLVGVSQPRRAVLLADLTLIKANLLSLDNQSR